MRLLSSFTTRQALQRSGVAAHLVEHRAAGRYHGSPRVMQLSSRSIASAVLLASLEHSCGGDHRVVLGEQRAAGEVADEVRRSQRPTFCSIHRAELGSAVVPPRHRVIVLRRAGHHDAEHSQPGVAARSGLARAPVRTNTEPIRSRARSTSRPVAMPRPRQKYACCVGSPWRTLRGPARSHHFPSSYPASRLDRPCVLARNLTERQIPVGSSSVDLRETDEELRSGPRRGLVGEQRAGRAAARASTRLRASPCTASGSARCSTVGGRRCRGRSSTAAVAPTTCNG